jgi:RNA polymerase sigma-70 factor (ECF subfamily)
MALDHASLDAERELLRRIAEKERDAFAELVRLHQRRVRCFVGGWVRDPSTLDDIAQEVFLAAFRKAGEFRGDSTVGAWLLGIARKQVLLYLRTQSRRSLGRLGALGRELENWKIADLQSEEATRERQSEIEALQTCLRRLRPGSADVVTQYYFQGRRVAEIARLSGKQQNAVKIMLFRIRSALRQCLERARTAAAEEALS